MSGILGRLFGRKPSQDPAPQPASDGKKTLVTGAGAEVDPNAEDNYEEFCRTVQYEPGLLLIDCLRGNNLQKLVDWLHPSGSDPEPKAVVAALLEVARQGGTISDLPEDTEWVFYTQGWDEYDGAASPRTMEALGLLAGALRQPVILFHQRRSDGEYRKSVWTPTDD